MTLNEVSPLVMRGEAQLVLFPALGGAVLLNQMGRISVSVKLIRLCNRLRCAVCLHPRMHVLTYTVAHTPNIMQLHAEARAHSYGSVYTHS